MTDTDTLDNTTAVNVKPNCGCNCGSMVNSKRSTFLPGHDARLVSVAVASSVGANTNASTGAPSWVYDDANHDIEERITKTAAGFELRFSSALASKYDTAARNAWDKAVGQTDRAPRKSAKRTSLVGQPAWVKIGRWFYNGEVASVTVYTDTGRENADSEVCVVGYTVKGETRYAQVDSIAMDGKWGLGAYAGTGVLAN